jgi:hypothetical protein
MRGMRAVRLLLPFCLATAACSGDDDGGGPSGGDDGDGQADDGSAGDDGGDDGGGVGASELVHDFPAVTVKSGQEITSLCLSWSLHNTEPVFVNSVTMNAGPGWHHSNWFYVPTDTFSVNDGVWECGSEFDQFTAALAGGVLFAQSTQATDETQAFPEGAVLELPPDAVVVSQVHLLNVADEDIDTGVTMKLAGVAEADVRIRLHPLSFDFHKLAIPPQQSSRFETECDMEAVAGSLDEVSLYYALPHYHAMARGMSIQMFGGERDGEIIHEIESTIGEPLGTTLAPPLSMAGARGIRFSCTYDNATDRTVGYGNSGEDEMCIFLAFTDSDLAFAGGVVQGEVTEAGMDGDVARYTGECDTIALPIGE